MARLPRGITALCSSSNKGNDGYASVIVSFLVTMWFAAPAMILADETNVTWTGNEENRNLIVHSCASAYEPVDISGGMLDNVKNLKLIVQDDCSLIVRVLSIETKLEVKAVGGNSMPLIEFPELVSVPTIVVDVQGSADLVHFPALEDVVDVVISVGDDDGAAAIILGDSLDSRFVMCASVCLCVCVSVSVCICAATFDSCAAAHPCMTHSPFLSGGLL